MLWPFDGSCDFDKLVASGWQPTPLNEFIVKTQTRCNLNCDYCYVYNLGDTSWMNQPEHVAPEITTAAALRIREHAIVHALPRVLVSLHGGEPLLRGIDPVREFVTIVRETLAPIEVEFSMQTNATLVTAEIAQALYELGVRVGVSIDGHESANRHRLDLGGKSTFDRTVAGITALQQHPALVQGALSVIDLRNDPNSVLDALQELDFDSADFLLPHGNWEQPPPGKEATREEGTGAEHPYSDWLTAMFDEWAGRERPMRVRIFDDIMHLLLGGEESYEALGLAPSTLAVIEADGSIELVDHIGISYAGAERTGANVQTHSLDEVLRHPGLSSRQIGERGLAAECRTCPLMTVCGGGLVSHRWNAATGFLAPSVYCADLFHLINHIARALEERVQRLERARVA